MVKGKNKLKRIVALMMALSLVQNPSGNFPRLAMAQESVVDESTPSDAAIEPYSIPESEDKKMETSEELPVKASNSSESTIYNGANSLKLSEDGRILANELYNTKLVLNVVRSDEEEDEQGSIVKFFYVSVADKEKAEVEGTDIEWIEYYDVQQNVYSNIPLPGDYYIAYETENDLYGYFDFGITIERVGLEKPENVKWNGNTVSWDTITTAENGVALDEDINVIYEAVLYKNSEAVTSTQTSDTSVDFSEFISGVNYGNYTVGVTAKLKDNVGDNRYHNSYEAFSEGNNYKDIVSPSIEDISAGTGEYQGKIVATAKDNLAVTDYMFTTSDTMPSVDDPAWKKVTSDMTNDGITTVSASSDGVDDFKINSAGYYYVYVKDAQGNIAGSKDNVAVSKINIFADFSDGTVDGDSVTKSIILVGADMESINIEAAESKLGYNFDGWYAENSNYENGPIKAAKVLSSVAEAKVVDEEGVKVLNIPAGKEANIYAKYSGQTYQISATADSLVKTYEGALPGKGITITSNLEKCDYTDISYSWQKKSIENGETVWTEVSSGSISEDNIFKNKLTVQNVADSGSYRVVATITVNGQEKIATSNEVVVTINKKEIKLFISDITSGVKYGDAAPTMDSEGVRLSYDLEATKSQEDGLCEGDDIDALLADKKITLGTLKTTYNKENATTAKNGIYDIVEETKTVADNYTFDVVKGTLTVGQKNVEAEDSNVKIYFKDSNSEDGYTEDYHEVYTGNQIKPEIIAFDGESIIPVSDYSYEDGYYNNINASTADKKAGVTVTFSGDYKGSLTLEFTIDQKEYKPIVKMKNKDENSVIDAGKNPAIYGDKIEAFLEENESGSKPVYYYAAFNGEQAPTIEGATTSVPENAGKYYVWAKLPATDNYVEMVTDPYEFSIAKRVIKLTAKSYEWTYNGKTHSGEHDSNGYTQEGNLLGADSFKAIKVSGSITDVGEVENIITYELTPVAEAHKDNYDIITVNGTLKVNKCKLDIPSDFAWSSSVAYPGKLEWTPISKAGVNISYTVRLYKMCSNQTECTDKLWNDESILPDYSNELTQLETNENAHLIYQFTTLDDYIDLTRIIRHDALENGVSGYYATVTVNPIIEGEQSKQNYDISGESNPTAVKNTVLINITKDDSSIKTMNFNAYSDGEDISGNMRVYIDNEYLRISAESKSGYDKPNFSCIQAADSANDVSKNIYCGNNVEYLYQIVHLSNYGEVVINATADDSKPIIKAFSFTNDPDSNFENVNVEIIAYDEIGLDGYAVVEAKDAASALALTGVTYTSFEGAKVDSNKNTTIKMTVSKEGKYYLLVKDIKGNVTVCSDEVAKTINVISFGNGKDNLEDDSLFGGEMKPCHKVSGTTINLPENKYTKVGYTFKDWAFKYEDSGEEVVIDGVIGDQASYAANKDVKLTAQWSDKQYKYKVEYYYMDVDGKYLDEPTETKEYTGGYGDTISNKTTTIRMDKVGFTFDEDNSFDNQVNLIDQDESYTVKVYYKRNQYNMFYSFVDPATGDIVSTYVEEDQEKEISQTYYYGAEISQYSISDVASLTGTDLTGYTFAGWNYTDYDNSQTTMPAKNVHVEAIFTANKVDVKVNYYVQDLPTIEGTIAGGDYKEIKSDNYKIYQSIMYSYSQGESIYETIYSSNKKAKNIEGFNIKSVVISKGAGYGASAPEGNPATAEGKASATTYINFYYTRDTYKVTLNVYKDHIDSDENIIYSKVWNDISYGVNLADTSIGSVDSAMSASEAMVNFGYDEDDNKNQWIEKFMDGGKRVDSFQSYILADYTGWSSGAAPETMPAGDVAITKEYIKKTTAPYKVEFYLETIKNNKAVYSDKPTYSIYKYDTINNMVYVQDTDKAEENGNVYVNYKAILKTLDKNADSYIYDVHPTDTAGEAITPVISGIVVDDNKDTPEDETLTLKLYFKRAEVATKVTYQFVDNTGKTTEIASYDMWSQWGTNLLLDPTAYFYGNGDNMTGDNATSEVYKIAPTDGKIYTAAKVNTDLIETNFNNMICEISYSGYYYLAGSDGAWPNKLFTKESEIYDSEAETYKPISFMVGQRGRDSETGKYADSYNRITITYSEVDVSKSYYMQLSWNAKEGDSNQHKERFVVENGNYCQIEKVIKNYSDDENHTPVYEYQKWSIVDGERTYEVVDEATYNSATAYNVRIANKKDIYKSTISGNEKNDSRYKVEKMLENNEGVAAEENDNGVSYVYNGVDTDHFTEINCITRYGQDTYYLGVDGTTGANNIYMVNNKNNQFAGNYITVNVDNANDCNNAARLGVSDASSRLSYGYYLAHDSSYRHVTELTSALPWENPVDYYNYYQNQESRKTVTLTFNGNSDIQSFEFGEIYNNPYRDSKANQVFTIDDGYRIVWYEDAMYTKPVNVEKTYKMEVDRAFFGRREKELIDNYTYASYELSNKNLRDASILALANVSHDNDSKTDRYYIDNTNYTNITWNEVNDESAIGESGNYVLTSSVTKKYKDDQFLTAEQEAVGYREVEYTAKRYMYFINGELVLIKEQTSAPTFSAINLEYTDDLYLLGGFKYDEKNVANRVSGYCQKTPIKLNAYYYRQTYIEHLTFPGQEDKDTLYYVETDRKYEEHITFESVDKNGYEFVGWDIYSYHITKDEEGHITGKTGAKYDQSKLDSIHYECVVENGRGTATIYMPDEDIYIKPVYKESGFEYDIMYYFQEQDGTYANALMESILMAEENGCVDDVAITYENSPMSQSMAIYSDASKSSLLALKVTNNGNTYYFNGSDSSVVNNGEGYTVTASSLIAAKKKLSDEENGLTTGTKYKVSDYVIDTSLFDIYDFSYASYQCASTIMSYQASDSNFSEMEFAADADMIMAYYYTRSSKYSVRTAAIALDATKEDTTPATGLTLKGDETGLYYGQEITLSAVVAEGYRFKGWYRAKDVLPDEYQGFNANIDLDTYKYIDKEKLATATKISPSEVDGQVIDTQVNVMITDNEDYIAVSEPITFTDESTVIVKITPGRTDYVYGYSDSPSNYLTAKVEIPESDQKNVKVIGYQWYRVNAPDGMPTSENIIPDATSYHLAIERGLDAKNYYYQCVVSLERTDNGRKTNVKSTQAQALVVRKYGAVEGEDYLSVNSYTTNYDGNAHTISMSIANVDDNNAYENDARALEDIRYPNKFELYVSSEPMTSWEDVQNQLKTGKAVKSNTTEATDIRTPIVIPEEFRYTNVKLDEDKKPDKYIVYYYLRTDDANLSPNYADKYGSSFVKIDQRLLSLTRANAFSKVYDNNANIAGSVIETVADEEKHSDLYRLANGEENGVKYFTINDDVFKNEQDNIVVKLDAKFIDESQLDAKDVDRAKSIFVSNLSVIYKKDASINGVDYSVNEVNYNYTFADGYTTTLAGFIEPYPLNLQWSDEDSFMYDGKEHAVLAVLKDGCVPPNEDVSIKSKGAQKNVGTYDATAYIDDKDKPYTAADYSLDVTTKHYVITEMPIKIRPVETVKTYNGKTQMIDSFEILVDGENDYKPIDKDGKNDYFVEEQYIVMNTLTTDKGAKDVGTYTIKAIPHNAIKIYDRGNADITYNFAILLESNTLTINEGLVTIKNVMTEDKYYDGTKKATLKTKKVTIDSEEIDVLDGVTLEGKQTDDTLYVRADAISNAMFEEASVGTYEVTFNIENPETALCGPGAKQYVLDIGNSDMTSSATIMPRTIVVSINDLSTGEIYGVTPNYSVSYTNIADGEDESLIKGKPTFLLDDNVEDNKAPINYETSEYQYSYTVKDENNQDITIKGTKIPVNENGYVITLEKDGEYVKGLEADNYVFKFSTFQDPDFQTDLHNFAKLNVLKREVTISGINREPNGIEKIYDGTTAVKTKFEQGTDYSFITETSTTGVIEGDTFEIEYKAAYNDENVIAAESITATEVGVKNNNNDQSGNYTIVNDTFTVDGKINPKEVTVEVDNKEITYGDAAPVYTAKIKGYVNADSVSISSTDDPAVMTFTCDYIDDKTSDNRNAGQYDIEVSDLVNTNYVVKEVNNENPKGTLTVKKKKVTVGVVGDEDDQGNKNGNPITIIYGKQNVPESYLYYTKGWVEKYDEEVQVMDSVAVVPSQKDKAIKDSISITLEGASDNDYVYTENGYTIYLKLYDLAKCESKNYEFIAENGVLNVRRQFISISGIETLSKVYDGNTNAKVKLDPKKVEFTCYFSGNTTKSIYNAEHFIESSLSGMTDADKNKYIEAWLADNISVTATYQDTGEIKDKDVGENKNVSLDVSLKEGSYLYGRFELIKTEEEKNHTDIEGVQITQSSTTDGVIERRPLKMMVYYGNIEKSSLAYGEIPNQDDFGYKFINGTSLVADETLASAGIVTTDNGKPVYRIVKNTLNGPVDYSPTSGVGKYYIKVDDSKIKYETNYILTVYGTNVDVDDNCKVDVVKNTLKTPEPVWSTENPGTIQFDRVEKIGNVDVEKYELTLYKDSTEIKADTINSEADTDSYSKDYSQVIRNNGPGRYTVSVKAIAETNEYNPVGADRNVDDSKEGTSNDIYAAYIDVKYAEDKVTEKAATKVSENAGKNIGKDSSSAITIAGDKIVATSELATYPEDGKAYTARKVIISGETATLEMAWYNENGYTTGYKLSDKPWTIKKGSAATTEIKLVEGTAIDNSAVGASDSNPSYKTDIKANLSSSETITMLLSLTAREVATKFTVDPERYEATYGYSESATPLYNTILDCSADNIGENDYEQVYKWEYQKGTKWFVLTDYAGKENVSTMKVPYGENGFTAYKYKLRCTLTLTRKDNGISAPITVKTCNINGVNQDIPMTIKKAVVSGKDIVAIADDWTYGEDIAKANSDNTGSLKIAVKKSGNIPVGENGIGTITYYFSKDKNNWTEWTSQNHPEDAGTYYLYAIVSPSENYDGFTTTGYDDELYTSFNITANKLQYVADTGVDGKHLFATDDLLMAHSKNAPYGLAKWPVVITPKENKTSTTNYITATYQVSLYRRSDGNSSFEKIKQYETSAVSISNGICSIDMASDMNAKGTYYYTVKAISSNKSNCEDSEEIASKYYEVFDHIKVTDSKGNELSYSGNDLEYTYNAKDITLSVVDVSDASYQWYLRDKPIENATTSSIKLRYVKDSDVYSCKVTYSSDGNSVDSNHLSITIKPKTITIVSGTETRNYNGTKLVDDKWWIGEDFADESGATTAVSSNAQSGIKSITELSTGNTVTGVNVTGGITDVLYDTDGKTIIGVDNTLVTSGVVITEPATNKVVYNSSMVTAKTANYVVKTTLGKLTVNKLPITITSGSKTWVYDTTTHNEHSYQITSGALATGDKIAENGGITYTGDITDVMYTAGENAAITDVDNIFTKVIINNKDGKDITANYDIEKMYGKLKVMPRGEEAEKPADRADFKMQLTVGGNTYTDNKYPNTGSQITPVLTIIDKSTNTPDGTTLVLNKDYVLENDSENQESGYGSYKIKAKFIGNYEGVKSVDWYIEDVAAPTGEIKIDNLKWNGFESDITYDIYKKLTVDVIINAKDEIGGSGIKSVKYYVYEKPNEDAKGLTENAVMNLEDSDWIDIENGGSFTVSPIKDIVVYARIEDNVGHVTYISSNGLVLENIPPVIENIHSEKTYCISREMKVTDTYLDTVKVVGKDVNGATLTSGIIKLDSNNKYKLVPVDGKVTVYDITATDKAGNESVISNVRINPVHTWKYSGNGTNKVEVICDIDTCEYHEVDNLNVELEIESGYYTGKAYVANINRSTDYQTLQVADQKASIGSIGNVTYYKLSQETAGSTTGGVKLSQAPVNAGFYYAEAEITCQGKKYQVKKPFAISKVSIEALSIMPTDLIYNGNQVGPSEVTVTAIVDGESKTLNKGIDYDIVVDESNNIQPTAKNVGAYTYKVKGIGNYTGVLEETYTVRDDKDPVITGITDNGNYCVSVAFKIEDPNLSKVTISKKVNASGNESEEVIVNETMTTTSFEKTLTGEHDGTKYTITAVDLSNNTTVRHITVYEDHLYEDANYVTQDDGTTIIAPCSHQCGAIDTETTRYGTIEWDYNYSYSVPESDKPETGVQGEDARATHANIELYQNNVLIATRIVDCEDQCGVGGSNSNGIGIDSFDFRKYNPADPRAAVEDCDTYIPIANSDGTPYSYYLKAVVLRKDENGNYVTVNDYAITESEDYIDEKIGHHFEVSYNPGCFDISWNVVLDELPNADGTFIKPDALYVKVLFAYSENATDEENANGYQVISQQAGVHDLGVLCTPINNGDGTYTYSGKYPVWRYQGGTTDSYYHRIQVVGYIYDGFTYDVEKMKYKSINDADHEKHTIYYIHEEGVPSGTIEYELSHIKMPVVAFDYNEGEDTTNLATRSISVINKINLGDPVTEEEIAAATTSRANYEFLGWYDHKEGGSRVISIDSLDESWQLYAHWRELVAPSMEIEVTGNKNGLGEESTDKSSEYITSYSFENYFDGIPEVKIVADDDGRGTGVVNSGVSNVKYYVSREPLPLETLKLLPDFVWQTYEDAFSLTDYEADIEGPSKIEGEYIVYGVVEDNAGNRTYVSSDGITIDVVAPKIAGVIDGQNYCEEQTITVTDKYIDKVIVNGEEVELDEDGNCILAADGTTYHIVVVDKAGHSTEKTVTVYPDHEYDEGTFQWNDDYTGGTIEYICKHDPSHIKVEEIDCKIDAEVRKKDGVPETEVTNLTKDIAREIFKFIHPEDTEVGKNIILFLSIIDAKNLVTAEEKLMIENKINELKDAVIAMYLDISLYLQVDDLEPEKITNTKGNLIGISIKIPEEFVNKDSNIIRTYYIVRVHNGKAEIMETKYDEKTNKISFETDEFSIYSLVYSDERIQDDEEDTEELTSEEDKTTITEDATSESDITTITEDTTSESDMTTMTEASTSESKAEEDKSSPNNDDYVGTGDDMPVVWLYVVMIITGLGICVVQRKKKKL